MKHFTLIVAAAIVLASCSNGSSGPNAAADSTGTASTTDTTAPVTASGAATSATPTVDTNGHILRNGKVRMGNDKVVNGDVKLSDSAK